MAANDWPATLPQRPLIQGYNEKPRSNVVETPMEYGPPKYRRRSTAAGTYEAVRYLMTSTQVETFWTFFHDTIKDGTLRYNHKTSREQTTAELQIVPDSVQVSPADGDYYHVDFETMVYV